VSIKALSKSDLYPEDLVAIVDAHALAPMYSFLTVEDQKDIIARVHLNRKTSVVLVDEIKEDLALDKKIDFYSVSCSNFGLLHSFSTAIATEKNWSPWNVLEDSEL
jgi:GTP cyclohydrolase FolE2